AAAARRGGAAAVRSGRAPARARVRRQGAHPAVALPGGALGHLRRRQRAEALHRRQLASRRVRRGRCTDGAGGVRARVARHRIELAEDQVPRPARARGAGVPEAARRLIRHAMPTSTASPPSRLSQYLNLIRWDRPAGSYLLLWPTLAALWIAAGGFPGWRLVVVFVLGTFLMRSAGCAVNDVADREFDRHVKRTANRPVTSGAIAPQEALTLGAALALAAFGLVLTTNPTAV